MTASSGGQWWSRQLLCLLLKAKELGLRPLAVHFDSWLELRARGQQHREHHLQGSGFDLQDGRGELARDGATSSSGLSSRPAFANCDIPTDHAFPAVAFSRRRVRTAPKVHPQRQQPRRPSRCCPRAWGHNAADLRYLEQRRSTRRARERSTGVPYPTLPGLAKQADHRYPYVPRERHKTIKLAQLRHPTSRARPRSGRSTDQPGLARLRRQALRVRLSPASSRGPWPVRVRLRQAPRAPLESDRLRADDQTGSAGGDAKPAL